MQTVLQSIGEFVAHEWRFFLIIPITACAAYLWAFVLTPMNITRWLVRLWPLSARLRLELGRILIDTEPHKAEAELRQAISLNPELAEAYFLLADVLLDQKERLEDAEQAVKQMLRQFPGHPAAYCQQGRIRERRERYAEAEKSYRAANAASPEFAWPCSLLGALLKDKLDNPLGAELAYRQAIRNRPGEPSNYFHLGNVLMKLGRPGEAVECYRVTVRKDRHDVASQVNLGLALADAGRSNEAARSLRRALRMRPRSPAIEIGLGRLSRKLKRRAEAEAAFRRAIEKDARVTDAYTELGQVLDEDACTMAEAEQVYRQGLQVDCTSADLNYNLAMLLRRTGREKEAIAYLEQVISADPADFEAYVGLAAIYKASGDRQSWAVNVFKARQFIPEDMAYALACLEAISDHPDLAFQHLKQAVDRKGFDRWWAWNDPDLEFVRADPRFEEIVGPCPEEAAAAPAKSS